MQIASEKQKKKMFNVIKKSKALDMAKSQWVSCVACFILNFFSLVWIMT